MYKITVNDKQTFDVEQDTQGFVVNNKQVKIDSRRLDAHTIHLLHDNKSYNVELVAYNDDKTAVVKVNGVSYQIAVQDRFDLLLHQLGMDNLNAGKINEVKAPMPGLVLNILVEEGQEVAKGDNLIVLEAMKMENILKSPTDGTVSKVLVKKGDKLEKNTVLIRFD